MVMMMNQSCSLTLENKKEKVKKFGSLRMLNCLWRLVCYIPWMEKPSILSQVHHVMNKTGLFKVTKIHELIQGSLGSMPAIKKGKLYINIQQVDGTEQVHPLWSIKFCPKAGVNLFFLMCELLQGNKIISDHQNNIVAKSSEGDILLECCIKTHDGWVARIKFLCETSQERASLLLPIKRKI